VLGEDVYLPEFTDPVIQELARRFPGLRPMSDGSLFDGLLTSIIGQSISVAAAAVTQAKLCALLGEGIELDQRQFHALPDATILAGTPTELIRRSGVTWKRAEAIVHAAQRQLAGDLPNDAWAREHPEETVQQLLSLPGVGRWTAESAVLWGIGAPDAHPTNDVALLRAAKFAYNRPEMTLRDLDVLAEQWRPGRALAARLLWTNLFGPAPRSAP
jgi:3-methyladenine DNA glycosylase/8-oxoguanine DNA glycosylase